MKKIVIVVAAALVVASTAAASGPITGKVRGVFNRAGLYGLMVKGQNLRRYVKTPKAYVWCAWQDGKVLVHVRIKNTSAEHLTVNWYPRYLIARGGWHGEGFSSAQSDGFDSGEVRNLTAKQDPKGVKDNSRIASCRPAFQMTRERLRLVIFRPGPIWTLAVICPTHWRRGTGTLRLTGRTAR